MILLCLASSTTPRRPNLLVALAQYSVTHFRSSSTKPSSWFLSSLLPRAQFIPGKDIYLPKPSFFIVFAVVVVVFFFLIKSLKSVSLKLLKTACLFFESILLISVSGFLNFAA